MQWGHLFDHVSFAKLKIMATPALISGWWDTTPAQACPACLYAQMPQSNGEESRQRGGQRSSPSYDFCQMILVDHRVWPTPGFIAQESEIQWCRWDYWGSAGFKASCLQQKVDCTELSCGQSAGSWQQLQLFRIRDVHKKVWHWISIWCHTYVLGQGLQQGHSIPHGEHTAPQFGIHLGWSHNHPQHIRLVLHKIAGLVSPHFTAGYDTVFLPAKDDGLDAKVAPCLLTIATGPGADKRN